MQESWLPGDLDDITGIAGAENAAEDDDDDEDMAEAGGSSSSSRRRRENRKPPEVLHAEIVEYLKRIPRELKATFVDIERELGINLSTENYVLDMLKSNPKVECEWSAEDDLSFQYRAKFVIANKRELLDTIRRVQCGISSTDICNPDTLGEGSGFFCYPGIDQDIQNLIVGGEIIACKNKAMKSAILYPRGKPFFVPLSGTVTATPGRQGISTSEALMDEIRRGDAIGLGDVSLGLSWYRVSSNVGGGKQAERATAPLSVTSETDLSDKNVYRDRFDAVELPLDGDYDG